MFPIEFDKPLVLLRHAGHPSFLFVNIAKLLADPGFREPLIKRIPVGRIGEFKDLMGLMLLCASDASEFLTGQTYLVDGGIASRQE